MSSLASLELQRTKLIENIVLAKRRGVPPESFLKELGRVSENLAEARMVGSRELNKLLAAFLALFIGFGLALLCIFLMVQFRFWWAILLVSASAIFILFFNAKYNEAFQQHNARLQEIKKLIQDENALMLAVPSEDGTIA